MTSMILYKMMIISCIVVMIMVEHLQKTRKDKVISAGVFMTRHISYMTIDIIIVSIFVENLQKG